MTTSLIPGIYTDYSITGVRYSGSAGTVGICTVNAADDAGLYIFTSAAEAAEIYGSASDETKMCTIMFKNGATVIKASDDTTYAKAAERLLSEPDVKAIVCADGTASALAGIKTTLAEAGEEGKYRVCFADVSGTSEQITTVASGVNHEQFCLAAGAFGAAAALAALCVSQKDPAIPFSGAQLFEVECEENFTNAQLELLIGAGVTPVRNVGGVCEIVRAVTTKTDNTVWRELNTILIVCDVIPTIKNVLKAMFTRAKNTSATRGAVRTQVMIELDKKKDAGIIDDYADVTVVQNAQDPTVCDVGFEFAAASGMQQMMLRAHITV